MDKIEDHDPCPCGSEIYYVDCCWLKELLEAKDRDSRSVFEEIKERTKEKDFQSQEEAQRFADEVMLRHNRAPNKAFQDLSSEQLSKMMYSPFEASDIVTIDTSLPQTEFQQIPIVKNTLYFLSALTEEEPIKATAKGNLPRKFAERIFLEIDDSRIKEWVKFSSEEDSLKVLILRHMLRSSGWIKKQKGWFSLTRRGHQILDNGFTSEHFFELYKTYVRKFNWEFQDRYPEFWLIQGAFLYSLFLLHKKATKFTEAVSLFRDFVRAFPKVVLEADRTFTSKFSHTSECFSLRFLERFCAYFGFVDMRWEDTEDRFVKKLFVQTSPFFKKYFIWHV